MSGFKRDVGKPGATPWERQPQEIPDQHAARAASLLGAYFDEPRRDPQLLTRARSALDAALADQAAVRREG